MDFKGAYTENQFLFLTWPLWVAQSVYSFILQTRKQQLPVWNQRLLKVYLIVLIVFGILRNLIN